MPPLQQDLGGGGGLAAARQELDRIVEIDLARGDSLREVNGVAGFEQDVEAPALHLPGLVLVPERCLGRLGHARRLFAVTETFPAPEKLARTLARTSAGAAARRQSPPSERVAS